MYDYSELFWENCCVLNARKISCILMNQLIIPRDITYQSVDRHIPEWYAYQLLSNTALAPCRLYSGYIKECKLG
jgi:hypothetical protein